MPRMKNALLAVPILLASVTMSYPAAGRPSVVMTSAEGSSGETMAWLLDHGARISGRTIGGGPVVYLPSDGLALEAFASGIVLIAVPETACA